jgi:hypothetical protein
MGKALFVKTWMWGKRPESDAVDRAPGGAERRAGIARDDPARKADGQRAPSPGKRVPEGEGISG